MKIFDGGVFFASRKVCHAVRHGERHGAGSFPSLRF